MNDPEQWRERLQREQQVRHSLGVAADRLESAEKERVADIAAAHRVGLSVRQIAAAVRLSPARVHQLLHKPVSVAAVRATTMRWDSAATQTAAGSGAPLAGIAALVRECTEWLDRLDREEFVAVNLRQATDPQTEYVAADRAHVPLGAAGDRPRDRGSGGWQHAAQGRTWALSSSTPGKSAAEARPAQPTRGARAAPSPIRSGAIRLSRKLDALP